ncbi:helicase, DEAD/DEAH box family (plasmid) [Legionella adelaidensis]|uniref:Helicase, DEAD/DEAH box family n=1 Tax=Legionella adelaidensis TaxID=45056 RepID=A0A0W0R430_9GAMM|nr:DEAD/DEAH box helicase [Legionella adelaidensis]KTC65832.1 helicase, DEAD/DEAH box family [Legionella adelaidensis]VEH85262.1 helicase, DEAD/DEAH box family [Legionella adelaidensis]
MISKDLSDTLNWAHPLVREWFYSYFANPTEPQIEGWPAILQDQNVLISAPTGSGKTLAAFLVCIDKLVRQAVEGRLSHVTQVVYVSPLKALTNDVQKNLLKPLAEIQEIAVKKGIHMDSIHVAVRTGDTLAKERQAMLKRPPHILVTTPESLYLLLTAAKSRENLRHVETVIIDEIHALANSKRGTHLLLSLVRLDELSVKQPNRISLSATQKPLSLVADFMKNTADSNPKIISIDNRRHLELSIEVPSSELGPVASNEMWDEIYDRLTQLIQKNRSTLIFVNTRKLAERVAHHLALRIGKENVLAHHGSLSRKLRLQAESKLKNGELKALVATASLELGIDIGSIDLVCQIGSTRSIAVALQRVGRAGHWYGAISKGKFFVTTRDELVEAASLVYAIKQGELDNLIIPEEPLDILAQQIVACVATEDWKVEELFHLIKKAFPYRHLKKKTFNEVISMLTEGIAGARSRYSAYLFHDKVHGIIKSRRGSRLTAITSGGAIPENGLFTVVAEPNEAIVGTLDEDFAVESNRGDIILLGSTSWKVKRIESARGRVLVEDAHGAPPSVPFWRGEAPSRTVELSESLSFLRKKISDMLPESMQITHELNKNKNILPAVAWLKEYCHLNEAGAEQVIQYLVEGRQILGTIPTQETVVIERFFDESGGMQLIIHSLFGARINKAWGLALRKRFCRSFNFELQAAATDNGINISLAEQHSFPLADVFNFLHPSTIKEVLVQAVLQSPLFTTRWRWDAMRSLALVRFRNGKKLPLNIIRMLSDDLLAAVFPDAAACQDNLVEKDLKLPNHPLINETMKDCLDEALDLHGLIKVLKKMKKGEIKCVAIDTPIPSVFSHEILNANPYAFLDDAPLEERRARAVEMRRILPNQLQNEIGKLDPKAIHAVQEQIWPDLRDADEMHDFLQTVVFFPVVEDSSENTLANKVFHESRKWDSFFNELKAQGRIVEATQNHFNYTVATEKTQVVKTIFPRTQFLSTFQKIIVEVDSREEAIVNAIQGWMHYLGPLSAHELAAFLHLDYNEVIQALHTLENSGTILRGNFKNSNEEEWCERRILARIHRLTLASLRKEIEPVTAAQFMRWLLNWQHLAPGTQLRGENGLLEIIRQLQGFEISANAWEREVFSKRIHGYQKEWLDNLCLNGLVGWRRLRTHPALTTIEMDPNTQPSYRRIQPTSITPITFFVRGESDWLSTTHPIKEDELQKVSSIGREIFSFLKENGASFFMDIVEGIGHLKSEIEMGLWELVSAGLITADGFDNLRALIDPKRRLGKRPRYLATPRVASGRWTLLKKVNRKSKEEQLESIGWLLLKRYGVMFRELLTREKINITWRELALTYRRLEERGEIRGGRFISGFLGEQFALPIAVDSLRAIKKEKEDGNLVTISAIDPLNLVGIILPGERQPILSKRSIVLQNGEQLLIN